MFHRFHCVFHSMSCHELHRSHAAVATTVTILHSVLQDVSHLPFSIVVCKVMLVLNHPPIQPEWVASLVEESSWLAT